MIKDRLSDIGSIDVSVRTVERYISELHNDFGVITCDRKTNLYSIDKDSEPELNRLLHFIHLFNSSDLILNTLKNKDKVLSYLSFETTGDYAGSANLEPIYSAIVQSRIISFDHENYEKNTHAQRTIKPYLLKEYNSKWYVVGVFADSNDVRIFGLDRISHVEISNQTFEKTEQKRISKLFDHLIGLVYDIDHPTTVKLSVTPGQAKYFKKAPLHASQELESENENEVIFSYWLIPNRELQRLILGYGSQVKVIHPQAFAQQIEEQINEMAGLYKK
ncbi:MAG: WYL domain-containing protein [Tannerella sp.]|nr:WYL domain-containing protein [Tannerella sp.]